MLSLAIVPFCKVRFRDWFSISPSSRDEQRGMSFTTKSFLHTLIMLFVGAQSAHSSRLVVYHLSKAGGTSLCRNIIKATNGSGLTEFQRRHNCNSDGLGPHTIRYCTGDVHTCGLVQKNLRTGPRLLFLEVPLPPSSCFHKSLSVVQLRQPLPRIISHLRHLGLEEKDFFEEKTRTFKLDHPLFTLPGEGGKTCSELIFRSFRIMDNYLVRMLLGFEVYNHPFGSITNHHLVRAKERLKEFSAVFFLDTGMVVNQSKTTIYDYMGGVLKIEFPVQPFLCNQGSRATNFTASFMSTLAALNVQDLELYDWATEQFL